MPSKQNIYKTPDYWSERAKREGYPARSVYKLEEIDEKFGVVRGARVVLDLGASPGSWTCRLLRGGGAPIKVVSVDLNPLSGAAEAASRAPGKALVFIRGDMEDPAVLDAVLKEGPYDAVLSDAAPLTTGSHTVDAARSKALVNAALLYAERALRPGGAFCAKLFQSADLQSLLLRMRGMFEKARAFKPKASRASSFETYLVGLNKR